MVKLKEYLILNETKVKPSKTPNINYKVLGVNNEVGVFINESLNAEETNQSYFIVKKNEICYNPYRINVGSIGLNMFDYNNQIVSGAYIVFACYEDRLNPKYLEALFKSKIFLRYVNEKANGGVRMNFTFEHIEKWEIPLPTIDEQKEIVTQLEKHKTVIKGVDSVLKNWDVDDFLDLTASEEAIGNIAKVDGQMVKDENLLAMKEELYVGGENIETGTGRLVGLKTVCDNGIVGPSYIFKSGQIIYSKVRPNLRKGFYSTFKGICSSDIYPLTIFNKNVLPEYFATILQSKYFASKTQVFQDRAGMPKINREQLYTVNVAIPSKNIQRQILIELNTQIEILEGLRKIQAQAKKRIRMILTDIWGLGLIEEKQED
ncbi:MAG: methylase [Mucilaginibacter sp.]|nr:methylase [Mucilaginibacter sp.]